MNFRFANRLRMSFCVGVCAFIIFSFASAVVAQKRRPPASKPAAKKFTPIPAVVIDERLSVLRFEPSLAAIPLQRMRAGREVLIVGERQSADGVTFYRVQLPPEKTGWVQAEAVFSGARRGDDEKLARLVRASEGFDQIERAALFLENFPRSAFRPAVLLLFGDLIEETAKRLTRDASRRLKTEEMAGSGAPVHSFYLNYNGLDRFRRLGAIFVFDRERKEFHYDGAAWREIMQKHPQSAEAAEARKRLDSLAAQMK